MQRAKRTRFLFFHAADQGFVDVAALLRGEAKAMSVRQLYAISVLRADEYPLTRSELDRLVELPAGEWVDVDETPELRRFADEGLIVTNEDSPEQTRLRALDARLEAGNWNVYGALYHSLTRWRDVDAGLDERTTAPEAEHVEVVDRFLERHGPPPSAFHRRANGSSALELPLVRPEGALYRTLVDRETSRLFTDEPLSQRELAVILYYVFGCHGYTAMSDDVVALRKTSPSGGALHPIECYPLLVSVEGIDPGVYHYDVARHALEPLARLDSDATAELAVEFAAGQFYYRDAAALFVLTARFDRAFWKYRNHERAFAVVVMDAAHLSQTFYLVCCERGLGAFVTGAINSVNIDERLGIDGFTEGSLALLGCGRRAEQQSLLQPEFLPFVPRETEL
jgi:putative peptide maturation dehydrogenase